MGDLTLFTIPHNFDGDHELRQINAIGSWKQLNPKPVVVLFGTNQNIANDLGCIGIENIERNKLGTPLINGVFKDIHTLVPSKFYCYVNTDILLTQSFITSFNTVVNNFDNFLAVGQRTDADVVDLLTFNSGWEDSISGKLHSKSGIDYFIFSSGLYLNIPPFLVGRWKWDNWLVWRALQSVPVIDATEVIKAIHQNHVDRAKRIRDGGVEAKVNARLARKDTKNIDDATWAFTRDGQCLKK